MYVFMLLSVLLLVVYILLELVREGLTGGARERQGTGIMHRDWGGTYLSNATCLIRSLLFYALFTVSRIPILCKHVCHC